jgi:hypothetical protein
MVKEEMEEEVSVATFRIRTLRFTAKQTNAAQLKGQSVHKGKLFLVYMHHDNESYKESFKFGKSMDVSCQLEACDGSPRDAGG